LGPFTTAADFVATLITARIQPDPGNVLFAVFDKTAADAPQLAGIIGFLETSAVHLCTEIGFVITLPRFQRAHVTSNAAGLLLRFALEPPAAGGLGLRRVAWTANIHNAGSIRVAERLGFRREGVLRWERVLPTSRTEDVGNGGGARAGDPKHGCLERDTLLLSLCWDDWEGGAGEAVNAIMQRGLSK
jgi:RimJ/RimL family protein N-acetyltransferase